MLDIVDISMSFYVDLGVLPSVKWRHAMFAKFTAGRKLAHMALFFSHRHRSSLQIEI
jgi:hypothetical protein